VSLSTGSGPLYLLRGLRACRPPGRGRGRRAVLGGGTAGRTRWTGSPHPRARPPSCGAARQRRVDDVCRAPRWPGIVCPRPGRRPAVPHTTGPAHRRRPARPASSAVSPPGWPTATPTPGRRGMAGQGSAARRLPRRHHRRGPHRAPPSSMTPATRAASRGPPAGAHHPPLRSRDPGLAHHRRGVQRAHRAVNLLIEKIKRVTHGFRSFDNYRLRLLLHCGVIRRTQPAARLRWRTSPHKAFSSYCALTSPRRPYDRSVSPACGLDSATQRGQSD
jgi:hypothetical protein